MGQAKLRGTLQQRVEEGIAKKQLEMKIAEEQRKLYLASLTPQQKKKMRDFNLLLASASIVTQSLNLPNRTTQLRDNLSLGVSLGSKGS